MRFTLVISGALLCLAPLAFAATEDKSSDEALILAAEQLVAEAKADVKTEAATTDSTAAATTDTASTPVATELKESEIPVTVSAPAPIKSESQVVWRLLASVGVLVVIGGVLIFATRRYTRQKDKGGQKTRIEIMHQFHMGPRKSLALVRVAGEAMLIGITDHNINMLKPITIIDDEMEEAFKTGFNNFLEDEFSIEDVKTALGARA